MVIDLMLASLLQYHPRLFLIDDESTVVNARATTPPPEPPSTSEILPEHGRAFVDHESAWINAPLRSSSFEGQTRQPGSNGRANA